jgi:hypothetical protein
MAGIAVPTAFLLIAMTVFTIARYIYNVPLPIERIIVFPMAVVPNAWGLWNILYTARLARRGVDVGLFGGTLAAVLLPSGLLVARLVGFGPESLWIPGLVLLLPVAFTIYYLIWKYLVRSLNQIVGVA